jgi:hypothetical protein
MTHGLTGHDKPTLMVAAGAAAPPVFPAALLPPQPLAPDTTSCWSATISGQKRGVGEGKHAVMVHSSERVTSVLDASTSILCLYTVCIAQHATE